jgi:peptidoglycan-associated lipoprotein
MFRLTFRSALLSLFLGGLLSACNPALQALKSGQKKFDNGEYQLAINDLKKATGQEPARVNFLLAESYRRSNRIAESAEYYAKALEAGSTEPTLRLHYGLGLKAQGKYREAAEQIRRFSRQSQRDRVLAQRARRELEAFERLDSLQTIQQAFRLQPITGLNTAGAEFSPVLLGEELVFTASRKETVYKTNGQPMLGLYRTKLASPTQAATAELFSATTFQDDRNEGTPVFSGDGKLMIFARGNTGKKKGKGNTADVDLYLSRLGETGWSEPEMIAAVSDSAAWDGSPALSADGRTLYFCSNRPGGVGGIDLYRANVDAAGRFGRPVNMGRELNTPGNEMFPYVSPEGKLYFASDGHPSLGGLDLFVATRNEGVIEVQNMGLPFNSVGDDFGLVWADSTRGYFSSNRAGGQGDDDIYYFESTSEPLIAQTPPARSTDPTTPGTRRTVRYLLGGTVVDPQGQPLDSVKVQVIDELDRTIGQAVTPRAGTFGTYTVRPDREYTILVERPGYFTKREVFSTIGAEIPEERLTQPVTDTTFYVRIELDRPKQDLVINKLFRIESIYYDFDKFNIRQDASVELDKIVQILEDNPGIKLELGSHTDDRGYRLVQPAVVAAPG